MAEHDDLIKVLNEAVSLEYTATVQYNQYSILLTGRDKAIFEDFFQESAKEALAHAKLWGDRIVYLGGVPSAVLGEVRQTLEATEMLNLALELETKAVQLYTHAHKVCKHKPTLYMLESHIAEEDKDVEELQKLLGKVAAARSVTVREAVASGTHRNQ